jgi:hypothetical protein
LRGAGPVVYSRGLSLAETQSRSTYNHREIVMFKRAHASLLLALVSIMLVACAGTGGTGPGAGPTAVPITDFKMVAGKWGGLVTGISAQHDDWIDVTIAPDGKYDFGIYRTVGAFAGTGTFTLSDGKLQSRGERGGATYTLYQSGAKRILQVQGALNDGRQVSAKLTPKE